MMQQVYISANEKDDLFDLVDFEIVKERNQEIQELEQDISNVAEINTSLASMIFEQGEQIDFAAESIETAEINIKEAVRHIEVAHDHTKNSRGLIFDACSFVAGTGLGAIGFISGPFVGVPTLLAGVAVSTCVVIIRRMNTK